MEKRSHFIELNDNDPDQIFDLFKVSRSFQLPVVKKGKLLGLLDLLSFFYNADKNDISQIYMKDFVAASLADDLSTFKEVRQNILPFWDDSGYFLGYIPTDCIRCHSDLQALKENMVRDVEYHKWLKEELDAIFETSVDGIFITDGAGTVMSLNKAGERIDDVKSTEVVGKNMRDLVAEGLYSESVTLKVLESKSPVSILQRTKNGKEIMATGTPILKDGEVYRVVVNSRDITELNSLKTALQNVQNKTKKYESELSLLRKEQIKDCNIISHSRQMKNIFDLALRIATVDSTILILGESGVGKEVVSKFIHRNSNRNDGPFMKIDCSGIPENLLESELFGYEKGAFTGASSQGKIGLIEMANEGTLFLDEVGEIPLNLQAKLLRMLQDREIMRIGGTKTLPVNTRVIAATHRNLEEMVNHKQFRGDLFYRLNVVPMLIPPLRERREDIRPFVSYFLNQFNKKFGYQKTIDSEVWRYLLDYSWPGNVRELENMMERLVVTTSEEFITIADLPRNIINGFPFEAGMFFMEQGSFNHHMDRFEKNLLEITLKKAVSTQDMADMLHIDVSTIRRKLRKHNIKIPF
jgi:PAS domain S-box-containing protein